MTDIAKLIAERDDARKALLIVQNAAKTIASAQGTELEHLRQNATYDHRLRAEHESLLARDAQMTDALLKAEAEVARLAAVVAEAQAERDEHLRLKNKLVLDAYRALDSVDAIRDGFRSAVHFVRNNAMNMERDYPEIVADETALESTLSALASKEKAE